MTGFIWISLVVDVVVSVFHECPFPVPGPSFGAHIPHCLWEKADFNTPTLTRFRAFSHFLPSVRIFFPSICTSQLSWLRACSKTSPCSHSFVPHSFNVTYLGPTTRWDLLCAGHLTSSETGEEKERSMCISRLRGLSTDSERIDRFGITTWDKCWREGDKSTVKRVFVGGRQRQEACWCLACAAGGWWPLLRGMWEGHQVDGEGGSWSWFETPKQGC